jgi:hypothetical protein
MLLPSENVTDEITPLGVKQTNLLLSSYQRQLLLLVDSDDYPLMCETGIPLAVPGPAISS